MTAFEKVEKILQRWPSIPVKTACERAGVTQSAYYAGRARRQAGIEPKVKAKPVKSTKRRPK